MKKLYYPALVDKDEDSDFGVSFPDFPGCVSAGETAEEALLGAQEALAGHVVLMLEDGEELPKPSRLQDMWLRKRHPLWRLLSFLWCCQPGHAA